LQCASRFPHLEHRNYGRGLQEACEEAVAAEIDRWEAEAAVAIIRRLGDQLSRRGFRTDTPSRTRFDYVARGIRQRDPRGEGDLLNVDYETLVIAGIEYVFGPDALPWFGDHAGVLRSMPTPNELERGRTKLFRIIALAATSANGPSLPKHGRDPLPEVTDDPIAERRWPA
jgi:hypothetical protein